MSHSESKNRLMRGGYPECEAQEHGDNMGSRGSCDKAQHTCARSSWGGGGGRKRSELGETCHGLG